MGQYYNGVIKDEQGKITIFHTSVDGKYMGAKLMEHSYWANPYVLAVASKLYRKKCRLAWVGDYADSEDFNWNGEFTEIFNDNKNYRKDLVYNGFRLEGKFFINYTKREFVDFDKYLEQLKSLQNDIWYINPVSLLTAVGNGKGGGDFRNGIGKESIGLWAWDELTITNENIYTYTYVDGGYKEELKPEFEGFKDMTEEYLFVES